MVGTKISIVIKTMLRTMFPPARELSSRLTILTNVSQMNPDPKIKLWPSRLRAPKDGVIGRQLVDS